MNREKVLVLADLGGCPPFHFYENLARDYNIVTYIPRPFAITKDHLRSINKFSIAIINDEEHFQRLSDFEKHESIYWANEQHSIDEQVVADRITQIGEFFEVSAIVTNNELFVVPVARACENLSLNGTGIKGAKNARDKYLMRTLFNQSGLKKVKCYPVDNYDDFRTAIKEIGTPLILKPTYLASSLGVTLFKKEDNFKDKFNELNEFINNLPVPKSVNYSCKFVAEEYLVGSAIDWYGSDLYGDYVSVEGLVINSKYYPLSITDKTPQTGFTETSHITPSCLDAEKKELILDAAKKANESLKLNYCSTHTEMKLLPNLEVGLIETAARFGGWNIIPNLDKVKKINTPKLLVDALINKDIEQFIESIPSANFTNFISDFRLYATDDNSRKQNFTFQGINDLTQYIDSNVKLTKYSEIEKGTYINVSDFKAFNSVCELELESKESHKIVGSINNILKNVKIRGDENK